MIAFLSIIPATGVAFAVGVAACGFWLSVRVRQREERRQEPAPGPSQPEPCRRCGARN